MFIDVVEQDGVGEEGAADEFAAMAMIGVAFATKEGQAAVLLVGGDEALEAVLEEGLGLEGGVIDLSGRGITDRAGGTAAEGIAHVDVADVGIAEGLGEDGLAVLRIKGGPGDGANVDDEVDGILAKKLQEEGEGAGAVADGEEHGELIFLANILIYLVLL